MIERVLITGVTGFVGTWMARYFKKSLPNCELWGTSFQSTAGPSGLDHFVQLDLRDKRSTYSLIEKCVPDRVVHLAGLIGNASLDDLISVNIIGTENLYQSLTELCNLDRLRVVQASSAAIYGPIELAELPISEEQTPRPITPYAISKLTQEYLALSFYRREGLQVILGRVFNILGPGQPRGLVPMTFIEQLKSLKGEHGVLNVGNIETRRDFVDVRDVVIALDLLSQTGMAGDVYNIASGKDVSIKELIGMLAQFSKLEVKVTSQPNLQRSSDILCVQGDISKITQATGWRTSIDIDESLGGMWG